MQQAEGAAPVVNVVPALDSKKQTTRYRESRVVTTTGAKVQCKRVVKILEHPPKFSTGTLQARQLMLSYGATHILQNDCIPC